MTKAMSVPLPLLLWALALAAVVFTVLLLLPSGKDRKPKPEPEPVTEGDIVTVHRIGPVTSVVIRSSPRDHLEGTRNPSPPPVPPEVTREQFPELYSEYMDPATSAIRRYDIIAELYSMGFTLPYISSLHEQWKRETAPREESPAAPAEKTTENTPSEEPQQKRPRFEPDSSILP